MKPRIALASIAALAALFAVMLFAPAASAHPPQKVECAYNYNTQSLTVTITHRVSTSDHYIFKVVVTKNGAPYKTYNYTNQPDPNVFSYNYDVPAADGDVLRAQAYCSYGGDNGATVTARAGQTTTGSYSPPPLWLYHAVAMSAGLTLLLGSVGFVYAQKLPHWIASHKKIGALGTAVSLIGLSIGVYMVQNAGTGQFQAVHGIIGIITFIIIFCTPIAGMAQLKIPSKGKRTAHIWMGRIGAATMIITVVLGLIRAGII